MTTRVCSHSGFQPLREVWLGDVYPVEFYSHLDTETQDIFGRITEMTRQDLVSCEKVLQNLGVTVQRPQFTQVDDYLDHRDQLIKPPITPRDWAITIGETLYVLPQYASGVEPYQKAIDLYQKANQQVQILLRDQANCDPLCWIPFPSIVRVGQDLYIDYDKNNSICESAVEEFAKHYRVHVTHTGDHSDGVFCPVKAGQIFSTHYRQTYNKTFPGWDVHFLTDTTQHRGNGGNGNWWFPGFDYPSLNEKLIDFSRSWLGNSQETVFEVNMLVINEHNVLCIAEDDRACRKLEQLGITPHVIDFKTRGFWDGGIHCLTLDIYRTGDKQDYWPDRGPAGIYCYD